MTGLSDKEKKAYQLLFNDRLPATQASSKMEEYGYEMSPNQLRTFKKKAFDAMMQDEKKERMSELMLESFERIKFEMEDLNKETKQLLEDFKKEGKSFERIFVLRELKQQYAICLKALGKFREGLINVKTDNVNILNTADFADAFKRIQRKWFGDMNAKMENGKLVFQNPSPELVDDFYRWEAEQVREARKA